jgi:hypothetical protein
MSGTTKEKKGHSALCLTKSWQLYDYGFRATANLAIFEREV